MIDTAELDAAVVDIVRERAKWAMGGNYAFADDDVKALAELAARAIDAGLASDFGDERTQSNMRKAAEKRNIEMLRGKV